MAQKEDSFSLIKLADEAKSREKQGYNHAEPLKKSKANKPDGKPYQT